MLNLAAIPALRVKLMAAVEEESKAILAKAQELIPKDTGAASASGKVVADGETVYVSFGANDDANPKTGQPTNSYIEHLEEDSAAHHPNGVAHFLRIAADESVAGFAARVAGRVR